MLSVLADQEGVASRRQLLAAGLHDHDIRRLLRRRELATVHPGVFVDHTGAPSWIQRAWAGVLWAWPAALSGESALRATDGPGRQRDHAGDIQVAVAHGRTVKALPGLTIVRRRGLESDVLWNLGPPRIRYEEAVLDVAMGAVSDLDAVAALSSACGGRRTTAARLLATAAQRRRVPRRAWIRAVLQDVADGTSSVLEHGYLDRVERAHGLPAGRRQVRAVTTAGPVYRDVESCESVIVELDGRLFHSAADARARDLERDLDATIDGRTTVRLGWAQVFDRACSTAQKLALVLRNEGWTGEIHRCSSTCRYRGDLQSPDD